MVSTIPSAVRGLTKQEAPSRGSVPSGSGRHIIAGTRRYSAYAPPARNPTVRPSRFSAPAPAATTTPEPSLPTTVAFPTCEGSRPRAPAASGATSVSPSRFACATSAPARSTAMSDGLSGAASTRTSTWPSRTAGTGAVSRVTTTLPSAVTTRRIRRCSAGRSFGSLMPSDSTHARRRTAARADGRPQAGHVGDSITWCPDGLACGVVYTLEGARQVLRRTPNTLAALLVGISDEWLHTRETEGAWSPYEVCGHL